jgi:hypothetical protein
MKYLLLFLLLTACEVKMKSDPVQSTSTVTQTGESYTYVVLRVEFIQQIKDLCTESHIRAPGTSDQDYKKIVADCTLNNLNLFHISMPQTVDFISKYCSPDSDLSGLSPEELINIKAACELF